MSAPETIFRQEALDSWARGRNRAGGVVRLSAPWHGWLYRATLLLVLAGVAALWLVRTQEQVSGPALVDQRTGSVTALLPAASAPELTRAQRLRVDIPGDPGRALAVAVLHARPADDTAVRRAGLAPLSQPGIILTGRLAGPPSSGPAATEGTVRGSASTVLRSERLIDLLVRQFRALLGAGEPTP